MNPLRCLVTRRIASQAGVSANTWARCASTSSSAAATTVDAAPAQSTQPSPPTPPTPRLRRPELQGKDMWYFANMTPEDLAKFDPELDVHPSKKLSPAQTQRHPVHVTFLNDDADVAQQQAPPPADKLNSQPGEDDAVSYLAQVTDMSPGEIRDLYRFPLVMKRVVNMKTKGKTPSMYSLVVVGNGRGLVGAGEGKDDTANKAVQKAFTQAVRSMDYVERYEDRTVWGTMESNFGTCKIQMRSRPPGFGLRVNPYVHQVAKAAGISDLSAKVYGSRNPTRVIKLAVAMLHGGSNPVDLGGFGHEKGQRKNKKTRGMQTAEEVGRLRGRKPV